MSNHSCSTACNYCQQQMWCGGTFLTVHWHGLQRLNYPVWYGDTGRNMQQHSLWCSSTTIVTCLHGSAENATKLWPHQLTWDATNVMQQIAQKNSRKTAITLLESAFRPRYLTHAGVECSGNEHNNFIINNYSINNFIWKSQIHS